MELQMNIRLLYVMISLFLCILAVVLNGGAISASSNTTSVTTNSTFYSVPNSELVAKWWQWWESIPDDRHPAMKYPDAERCSAMQEGAVWFLPDATELTTNENVPPQKYLCEVPVGKSMLLPLSTSECNPGREIKEQTDDKLKACAFNIETPLNNIEVKVDGITLNISKLGKPIETGFFNITYPQNPARFWGDEIVSGTHRAIAQGYFLLINPLSPGKHTLEMKVSDDLTIQPGQDPPSYRKGLYEINIQ